MEKCLWYRANLEGLGSGGEEWGNIGKRGERGMDGGGMAGKEMEGVGKIGGDYRGL